MTTNKEWAFYITVGVVVVVNELALRFGGHLIVFPLSLLLALAVGCWAFPSKKK
jgi:hypothetical protein